VYGFTAIAAISLIMNRSNAGGEAAHLGGAIAGFFFIRRTHLLRDFFDIFGKSGGGAPVAPRRAPARGGGPSAVEIDRILAKVATQGLASLTESEKATLRAASETGGGGAGRG
jgi:hypothetical protein